MTMMAPETMTTMAPETMTMMAPEAMTTMAPEAMTTTVPEVMTTTVPEVMTMMRWVVRVSEACLRLRGLTRKIRTKGPTRAVALQPDW
jgi:hypothetical protein